MSCNRCKLCCNRRDVGVHVVSKLMLNLELETRIEKVIGRTQCGAHME